MSETTLVRDRKSWKLRYWRNAKRKTIFLGSKINKKTAEKFCFRIDQLLAAKNTNFYPDDLLRWIYQIEIPLYQKLEKHGLAPKRHHKSIVNLFSEYVDAKRHRFADTWFSNQQQTAKQLNAFFGDKKITSITTEDAQTFRDYLATEKKYANATVAGHIKRVKAFLNDLDDLHFNPFTKIEAGAQSNAKRKTFISQDKIERLIDFAPNNTWKCLIALARYGGLRNTSETFALKWEQVDWHSLEINVPGSKGRHGPRWRVIPIYPELVPHLKALYEEDPTPEMVINIPGTAANCSNQFKRIVKKAGFDPWTRIWQNLRASRDTELTNAGIPVHVVAYLMGNSVSVSNEHYKMISPRMMDGLKGNYDQYDDHQPPTTGENRYQRGTGITCFPAETKKARVLARAKYTPEDSNL